MLSLVGVVVCLQAQTGAAQESRGFRQIHAPATIATQKADQELIPVDRKIVEEAVRRVVDSWNTQGLDELLAGSFLDKQRVVTAVDGLAPKDARLRLMDVRAIQTLAQQRIEPNSLGGKARLVSTVSATVRTQLEFNDPQSGFQRRSGTNEYLLEITQVLGK